MGGGFAAVDPDFATRVHDSFSRQAAMRLIGARLARLEPGLAEIELSYREDLTQQHGFFHGIKPGRTLTVCALDVAAIKDGKATPIAHGLQTLMCLHGRSDGIAQSA